jgi:hypothetical protein
MEGDGQTMNDYTDEDYGHDNYDGEDESTCQFCKGRGYQTSESDGSGPAHACPDCSDGDDEE